MSATVIGLASVGVMIALIYAGVHVAVALAATSFAGVLLIRGNFGVAANMTAIAANEAISDYIFGVVPLFVLMGLAVSLSGIGFDTFAAANRFFGRMRGGVGVATVAANAIFAAITGISIASAAVFSKVAVPEMIRHGYDKRLAVGIVAGSSILGMLIPPSLLFIVYGIITEQSIGDLFIAAIVPGLLMSVAFGAGIVAMVAWRPALVKVAAAADAETATIGWGEALGKLFPIALLVAIVLGGIYGGFFTPTEAGAAGALAALVFALVRRTLNGPTLWRLLSETGHVTASVCLLIVGAAMYSRMLALSGVPNVIGEYFVASDLGFLPSLIIYLVIILLLGTIIDSISILLIMVPLAAPVFIAQDVNMIWFGIISIVAVEIGIITPPMGIGVFVVKDSLARKDITLGDVFLGAAPFVAIMAMVLVLLVAFPQLSLFLLGDR
jgi:tripartite ATP-independent transporter DctM subunit